MVRVHGLSRDCNLSIKLLENPGRRWTAAIWESCVSCAWPEPCVGCVSFDCWDTLVPSGPLQHGWSIWLETTFLIKDSGLAVLRQFAHVCTMIERCKRMKKDPSRYAVPSYLRKHGDKSVARIADRFGYGRYCKTFHDILWFSGGPRSQSWPLAWRSFRWRSCVLVLSSKLCAVLDFTSDREFGPCILMYSARYPRHSKAFQGIPRRSKAFQGIVLETKCKSSEPNMWGLNFAVFHS